MEIFFASGTVQKRKLLKLGHGAIQIRADRSELRYRDPKSERRAALHHKSGFDLEN
jgi:hypothetical protein